MNPRPRRPGLVLALCAAAWLWPWPAGAAEATLYRDTWGVPHVYADSREAAAYAHGYAQAEDRLEDLLRSYLLALGRAASVFGPDALETDVIARTARHEQIARERYPELNAETRGVVEAFVAGVRDYMRAHPAEVPSWGAPPEPHHVVALYRGFAWVWPWGQARGDLKRIGSQIDDGRGSNQWVVGTSRSAEGAPIALIDPHLAWEPQNRFYEAHVHGGDLNFYGFSIIGTPVMAMGHTDVLSFGLTTGGPDCADVYEERIHPEDPLRYEYDGEWRAIEVEETEIAVKLPQGVRRDRVRIERTHHGPIVERRGRRAWAVRTGYDREIGIVEQWLNMVRARNLGEFLNALRANQSLPQNMMYADVYGNTYYVRAGRVPRRPHGFAWDRPVAGWTSETEWLGLHALADLVQMVNPPGGFMQNCNVSPGAIMPASPLTADRYPQVVYNERTDRSNGRGRRALALLDGTPSLTLADALRFAVDTYSESVGPWQRALRAAREARGELEPPLDAAADLLLGWDGHVTAENRAAVLFDEWTNVCRSDDSGVPGKRIAAGEPLDAEQAAALLAALDGAVATVRAKHARIDVAWGSLHRLRRGHRSWPIGGAREDFGTLRSVRFTDPDELGVSYANGGQICTTVVVLREGNVISFSATPFGQSDQAGSKHYADQAEQLFSRGLLKPTWYPRDELLEHVESKRTLTYPAPPPAPALAGGARSTR